MKSRLNLDLKGFEKWNPGDINNESQGGGYLD